MHARKWLSNSSSVLRDIPIQNRKAEVDLDTEYSPSAKKLGEWWLADQNVFYVQGECAKWRDEIHKKQLFEKVRHTYRFLAPVTIRAKILSQKMWMAGLDLDDELSDPYINSRHDSMNW